MNQKKIKIIKRYISRFVNCSFCIAGGIFFAFTFSAITLIPTLKPSDIGHVSSEKMVEVFQLSLNLWQSLFWVPIVCGLAFTLIEGLVNYSDYKRKLRKASNL